MQQGQLDGTLLITATGSSLTTLQPVTLTFQTTTPVDITSGTLEPSAAPSVGDNITVTQWVNGAASYCGGTNNCANVSDQQAGVVFQSGSGSGYSVSGISDLLRVDSEAIVQVTPATAGGRFDFGIVPHGTSKPQTFTLTNHGYDDIYVQDFGSSNEFLFPDPYPITNNNCKDVTLYSGGVQSSCTATITADGTAIGNWNCPDIGYTFFMSRNPDPVTAVPFDAKITIGGCDH